MTIEEMEAELEKAITTDKSGFGKLLDICTTISKEAQARLESMIVNAGYKHTLVTERDPNVTRSSRSDSLTWNGNDFFDFKTDERPWAEAEYKPLNEHLYVWVKELFDQMTTKFSKPGGTIVFLIRFKFWIGGKLPAHRCWLTAAYEP